jgi:hypothetical protein
MRISAAGFAFLVFAQLLAAAVRAQQTIGRCGLTKSSNASQNKQRPPLNDVTHRKVIAFDCS